VPPLLASLPQLRIANVPILCSVGSQNIRRFMTL
jgi:hypothetical protein